MPAHWAQGWAASDVARADLATAGAGGGPGEANRMRDGAVHERSHPVSASVVFSVLSMPLPDPHTKAMRMGRYCVGPRRETPDAEGTVITSARNR